MVKEQEIPAFSINEKQLRTLMSGKGLVMWIGDRNLIIDYDGKLRLCKKIKLKKVM